MPPNSDIVEQASESTHALLELLPHKDHQRSSSISARSIQTDPESPQISLPFSPFEQACSHHHLQGSTVVQLATFGRAIKPRSTIFARLGCYLALTNIATLLLLLAAISALSFLWFGNDRNILWRHLMTRGWIGQAVTLCTLAIRLAVAIQASTAVAMLASISLESSPSGGVLLAEVPALSLARYVNTGPLTSLLPFWNNWSLFEPKLGVIFGSVALLAVCTLLSQFTSTILLWDVRGGVARGFSRTSYQTTGMGMEAFIDRFQNTVSRGQNYWHSAPQTFPTFAEWNEKPHAQLDHIVDTGPTIRAFLPINSQLERSMLEKFEGISSAFDARVACVRPNLTDWSFVERSVLNDPSLRGYFDGYARPTELTDEIKQILRRNETEPGAEFRCIVDDLNFLADPMFKVCSVSYSNGGLINSLDQTSNSSMQHYFNDKEAEGASFPNTNMAWISRSGDGVEQWPIEMGHTFLLLRSKGDGSKHSNSRWKTPSTKPVVKESGVWVDFPFPPTNDELSVTLCYDAWYHSGPRTGRIKHVQQFPISAQRPNNNTEPAVGWNAQRKTFDTTAVIAQLGASKDLQMDRGVFSLNKNELDKILRSSSQQWSPSFNFSFHDVHLGNTLWFLNTTFDVPRLQDFYATFEPSHLFGNYPTNETYDFLNSVIWWPIYEDPNGVDHFEIYAPCENCTTYSKMVSKTGFGDSVAMQILSPITNAIFRDTLLDTDNPALAWQALMTTVLRMAYYDWLPTFDSMTRLETKSKVPCQMPLFYRGFAIVMANLGVHLAVVTAAAVCFGRMTMTSLLNNSWQVVAQLKTRETERLLDHATMAHDSEVKRWIEQSEDARRRFWLTKNESCGVVHLS